MAVAFRVSMEEERATQEAAAKEAFVEAAVLLVPGTSQSYEVDLEPKFKKKRAFWESF